MTSPKSASMVMESRFTCAPSRSCGSHSLRCARRVFARFLPLLANIVAGGGRTIFWISGTGRSRNSSLGLPGRRACGNLNHARLPPLVGACGSRRSRTRLHGFDSRRLIFCRPLFLHTHPGGCLRHQPDGPEIVGKIAVGQIGVGHGEIAALPPTGPPRIAHDKASCRVVVSHSNHCVSTQHFLSRSRDRHDAGCGHLLTFKALVHGEFENERIARSETSLHLIQHLRDSLVMESFPQWGVTERLRRRSFREFLDVVGPIRFGRCPNRAHALYTVANLRSTVRVHSVFHCAFVIVDKQTGRRESCFVGFLELIKLQRSGNRVGRATPQLPLVVHFLGALGRKVDLCGER